ncbi:MAG: FKBP-type peptidyl-prolyl cis-trans isomerase [Bacteroidales bacterium]|jgi:FKBP-type peptidyl-prolyl cis-trans isomerase FklB|nr:FKBP-type peptidyl-prolyl cis-trans isomerase [Bacteroidales bacterium]
MKNFKQIYYVAFATIVLVSSCTNKLGNVFSSGPALKTEADSASYYLGYFYSNNFIEIGDELNPAVIAKGWDDAKKKVKSSKSDQEIQVYLNEFFMKAQTKYFEKAKKEGEVWLEENKKKTGVVTMPSGLQYRIVKEGSGIKPEKEDAVHIIYHGTLIDGTVFDSSKDRNDTVNFPVSGVVPGFSEALTLMNEGSVWEVYIPSDLGYGAEVDPRGPIKPNSVLVFEINLLKVDKAEAKKE